MPRQYAILTGDLIASSAMSAAQLDAAFDALQRAASRMADWDGQITTGFGRRGGDGWQFAAEHPARALRYALMLRAELRCLGKTHATRIAIATGPGTLPPDHDPNGAHGAGFIDSGRLLEGLPAHVGMAHASGGALGAAVRLADHISAGWTPAQARAMREMLWPRSRIRAEAAAALGITRQAVNQALWSAGFPALSDALDLIEGDTP